MGAPKEPRKKSKPKKGNGPAPWQAPKNNYFATLMETPEGRALRSKWSRAPRKNAGRPRGVPDGYRKHEIEPVRAQAQKEATEIVKIMSEKFGVEDEHAQEALKTAVEIMRVPGETRERLAAARLVLDFTKQKPASKSEVAVSKAEDFLASLLTDDDSGSEAKAST